MRREFLKSILAVAAAGVLPLSTHAAVGLNDRKIKQHDNGTKNVTVARSGFHDLDRMTSGLQPGNLILLASRQSIGKSAFAHNIAENVAVQQGLPVMMFSMKMSASQIEMHMAGSLGHIDQERLSKGHLNDAERGRLSEAVDRIKSAGIFIDDTVGLTLDNLCSRARHQARDCGRLGLIVVDYLQLIDHNDYMSVEDRATELVEFARALKTLAKELQCPVIALSQVPRSLERRRDKRPMMSDLRHWGGIEQPADVVLFLYRDDYYYAKSPKQGVAEVIIGKQRNGPVGSIDLAFHKKNFDNLPQRS